MNQLVQDEGWIGVDLDGTLAHYESNQYPNIGAPIPLMVNRVLDWLNAGTNVKIMTARATVPDQIPLIEAWCLKHLGRVLPITCCKDFMMICLYDDRAYRVEFNTGKLG